MGQMMLRLLLKATSLSVLMALVVPLLTPIGSAAEAAPDPGRSPFSPTLSELPSDSPLKDDDDDGDDDDGDDDDDDGGSSSGGSSGGSSQTTTTTTTVTQVRYTDITTTYWASSFIYRLASINVVSGFPDGEFLPNAYLTKAQYAALVTQAFNISAVREVVAIRNVSQFYWGYSAIQRAYAMGFVNLDGGTFDPEASMTKLDFLVMLAQALGYTEVTSGKSVTELLSVFSDADTIPSEYRVIIAALVEKGVIVNYPNVSQLNLFSRVTRAEGCAFIYQAMASLGLVERVTSTYIVDIFGVFQQTDTTTDTGVIGDDGGSDDDDDDDDGDDDDDDGDDDDDDDDGRRQNCNQGIGNGAEGCDPGNSAPRGGSNDEGGRTPGNRP